MLNSRLYTVAALLLSGLPLAAQLDFSNLPPPGPSPNLVKIKENIYVLQNPISALSDVIAYGGNAIFYLTDAGLIMVDSKSDREHDDLIAKLKNVTDKPVRYVILTHGHGDHAGGAAKLRAMGATLVISENDREIMARSKDPSTPDLGYIGQARLVLGGKEARLREFRGHTLGDTVVYFPAERVICLGDLLTTADTLPPIVSYAEGGSWMDWARSIDQILEMDFDTAIPGHGPPITKAQLVDVRRKFERIFERVRAMNRDKKSADEITQTLIKEFNWGSGPSAGQIPGIMMEMR